MSFIADRSIAPLNRRNVAVTLAGTGTSWTQGGTAFSLSGTAAAGSSITTTIVNSATNARIVLTIGGVSGTLTISDGTSTIDLAAKVIARWPAKGWVPGM